ncbi:type II secretion system F family protein [Amycolatopsis sp. NPDC051373]|uniref:type II secretion system F family protein n=1 Tax=Amycolatopsis sp. NPDC051373 TaxID=3155801 RepID=UPI00344FBD82
MTTTTTTIIIAASFGAGAAGGVLLILSAPRRSTATSVKAGRVQVLAGRLRDRRVLLRLAVALAAGIVAAAVTGWVVGVVLAAAAVWFLPQLVGPDRAHARRMARIEAIAGWTEMLRDVLSAAAGLEQAILETARLAPPAIRLEIASLAARLSSGQRLAPALRQLAGELDHPMADLVLAALVLAAERQARQLTDLLGSLAATAREQAATWMRVESGRARIRTSVRVVVATTLVFAGGVVVFDRAYLDVYNTTGGQLALLLIGAVFTAGFAWLTRIATSTGQTRPLTLETPVEPDVAAAAHDGGERR